MSVPKPVLEIQKFFAKLPGVGEKTALRYALSLLEWEDKDLASFGSHLQSLTTSVGFCQTCGCLKGSSCTFCQNPLRSSQCLLVVKDYTEVLELEKTRVYSGTYHVLHGLLDPFVGVCGEATLFRSLEQRIAQGGVEELILAFEATFEGDATAEFLRQRFRDQVCRMTRPALGMPMGSSMSSVDPRTLKRAFELRVELSHMPHS